jgi:membrane protease YdiL (CAAX protease family)
VVLIIIQATRASIIQIWNLLAHTLVSTNFLLIVIGVTLYFIYKPDIQSLGLSMFMRNKRTKIIYILSTCIVLMIILTTPMFSGEYSYKAISSLMASTIIIPVFEELIFRGYIWNKLKSSGFKESHVFIITTILFGLWHLGYWDVIYIRVTSNFSNANIYSIMFFKVLTGIAFGIFTGIARWRTKSSFSSILIHSFFNIFGR